MATSVTSIVTFLKRGSSRALFRVPLWVDNRRPRLAGTKIRLNGGSHAYCERIGGLYQGLCNTPAHPLPHPGIFSEDFWIVACDADKGSIAADKSGTGSWLLCGSIASLYDCANSTAK